MKYKVTLRTPDWYGKVVHAIYLGSARYSDFSPAVLERAYKRAIGEVKAGECELTEAGCVMLSDWIKQVNL